MQLEDNGKFISFTLVGEAAPSPTASINGYEIGLFIVYDEKSGKECVIDEQT